MLDAAWGLGVAEGLLQSHTPADISEAPYVSARAATQLGKAEQVAPLPDRHGFIAEQASWTEAAARARALSRDTKTTSLAVALMLPAASVSGPGHHPERVIVTVWPKE
jgi:hypothetical protein